MTSIASKESIQPKMLVIAKKVKIRDNSPVEFDFDGTLVIGTVVRYEGGKVAVRYGAEKI